MRTDNPFKGNIEINESTSDKKMMRFDATPRDDAPITKTLMVRFKSVHFSPEEKRNLTRKDREILFYYANVANQIIEEYSAQLVQKVSKAKSPKVTIKANEFGVFICLAAFMSNKLPKDKKVEFQLGPSPLSLFPKKFVTPAYKKGATCDVHTVKFHSDESSWLDQFKTICDLPSYLKEKANKNGLKIAA